MQNAFENYLRKLDEARQLYQSDVMASRIHSIAATIAFLRDAGAEPALRTPLLDALSHLSDEAGGRTGNWDSSKHNADWASACAAVTFLAKAGRGLTQAAQEVERATGMSSKRLLQVRKNLLSGNKSRDSKAIYDSHLKAAKESGLDDEKIAKLALEGLREKVLGAS